jgi:cytochrome c2
VYASPWATSRSIREKERLASEDLMVFISSPKKIVLKTTLTHAGEKSNLYVHLLIIRADQRYWFTP